MAKKKSKKTGLPPGSVVFTGRRRTDVPLVKVINFDRQGLRTSDKLPNQLLAGSTTWLDVTGLHDVDFLQRIGQLYNLHQIILEDVADIYQRPKIEIFGEGIFIILKNLSINQQDKKSNLNIEQISIYATKNLIITFQEDNVDDFASIRERLQDPQGRLRTRNTDYFLYRLLDIIVDNYYVVIDELEQVAEDIEQRLFEGNNNGVKQEIHRIKLQANTLRKIIVPLREAVGRMMRSEHSLLQESNNIYLRDLFDHIIHTADLTESLLESSNGLYDLYLSEMTSHVNQTMRLLTVISTIFIPLTFIVGVYGMNFDVMPELHHPYGYFILCGIMFAIFIGQIIYFKKRNWM